ncbi:unnamed protein product [Nezara viridula]|uniref:Uncharacterized protein n=1 Tax=Nezara viridula TaxID=85310 RepID=A0A9P0HQK2_NEZVI|nr:unnamed protein product [Nezara viridula]
MHLSYVTSPRILVARGRKDTPDITGELIRYRASSSYAHRRPLVKAQHPSRNLHLNDEGALVGLSMSFVHSQGRASSQLSAVSSLTSHLGAEKN